MDGQVVALWVGWDATRDGPAQQYPVVLEAKAGVAYAELGNLVKARGLLKRVVDEYPQSAETALARRRLAELQ